MIRLTLMGEDRVSSPITGPYFRITGGVVWTRPGQNPLVRYCENVWWYGGERWSGMRFEGRCRLVFGLLKDPAGVSDLLNGVSIHHCLLSANGIAFAAFEPEREMWRGVAAEAWWHSFRLESGVLRSPATRSTEPLRPAPWARAHGPDEETPVT